MREIAEVVEKYRTAGWGERRKILLFLRSNGGYPAIEAFERIARARPGAVWEYVQKVIILRRKRRRQKTAEPEPEPPKIGGEFMVDPREAHDLALAIGLGRGEVKFGYRDATAFRASGSSSINPRRRARRMEIFYDERGGAIPEVGILVLGILALFGIRRAA